MIHHAGSRDRCVRKNSSSPGLLGGTRRIFSAARQGARHGQSRYRQCRLHDSLQQSVHADDPGPGILLWRSGQPAKRAGNHDAVVLSMGWTTVIWFVVGYSLCFSGVIRRRHLDGGSDPPPMKWSDLRYVFWQQGRTAMPRKSYKPEEIVAKLRQVDVLISQGQSTADAIRQIGVTEVTYYRWRREFGGLKGDQVRRLKELEQENARLRRAVSDLTLDKLILTEAAKGNF